MSEYDPENYFCCEFEFSGVLELGVVADLISRALCIPLAIDESGKWEEFPAFSGSAGGLEVAVLGEELPGSRRPEEVRHALATDLIVDGDREFEGLGETEDLAARWILGKLITVGLSPRRIS
ncbi:MAG: hypothetical protein HYY18_07075 [Planctomycetes bacterium]|nr:hypothetical protein [Planctomycetota bacterium]